MTEEIIPAVDAGAAPSPEPILSMDGGGGAQAVIETAEAPVEQPKQAAPEAKPEKESGPKWFRDALEKKNRELNERDRRLQNLEQQLAQQAPRPAHDQARGEPDFMTVVEERFARQNIALSERFARREHGQDLFEEAKVWLSTRPDIEGWAQRQDDPWGAAIQRYKQERMAEEIGDDPTAYRERLRQELLAEMQQGGLAPAPAMTQQPRIPQPASTARTGGQPRDASSGQFTFRNKF